MEAAHFTLNSTQLASVVNLPMTLRDRVVEMIVFPSQAVPRVAEPDDFNKPLEDFGEYEEPKDEKPKVKSILGILKQYANPALVEQEKGAWERAAAEKYLEKMKEMNDDSA